MNYHDPAYVEQKYILAHSEGYGLGRVLRDAELAMQTQIGEVEAEKALHYMGRGSLMSFSPHMQHHDLNSFPSQSHHHHAPPPPPKPKKVLEIKVPTSVSATTKKAKLHSDAPAFVPHSFITSSDLIDLEELPMPIPIPIPVTIPVPIPVPIPAQLQVEIKPLIELADEDVPRSSPSFDKASESAWGSLDLNTLFTSHASVPKAPGSLMPCEGFNEGFNELKSGLASSSCPPHPLPPSLQPLAIPQVKALFVPSAIKNADLAKAKAEEEERGRESNRMSQELALSNIFVGDPNAPLTYASRLPSHCCWFILEDGPAMKIKGPIPGANILMGINAGLIIPSKSAVCGIDIKGRPTDLLPLSQHEPPLSLFLPLGTMIEEARRGRAYELIHWSRLNVLPTSPFNTFPSSLSYFPSTLVAAPLIVHPPQELLIEKDLHDDKLTVDDPSIRGGKVSDQTVPIPSPPAAAQVQVQPRPLKLMARPLGIPFQVPTPQVPTPQISVVPPSWAKIATQSLPVSPPAAAGSTVSSLILKERAAAGKPPKSPFPMTPTKQPSKDSSSSSSDLEGGSSRSYESTDGSRPLPSVKDKIQHNGQVRKQCRKVGTTRTDEDRARVQREVEARSGPEVCHMEAGMIHATNSNESCMPHRSSYAMYEDLF